MVRFVTYLIATLGIVFLTGSRAVGGTIYASDIATWSFHNESVEMSPAAELSTNTPIQKPMAMAALHGAPAFNTESLISKSKQDSEPMFSGLQDIESPTPLHDFWKTSDYSLNPQSAARGLDVTSDLGAWQALMPPTDIRYHRLESASITFETEMRNAVYSPQLAHRDYFSLSKSIEVPVPSIVSDSGMPAVKSLHTPLGDVVLPTLLQRSGQDFPGDLPVTSIPRDALRSPTGSEIVNRALRGNANRSTPTTGHDESRQRTTSRG